jgi:hypothetical protein
LRFSRAGKPLEDLGQLVSRDANAAVDHRYDHLAGVLAYLDPHGSLRCRVLEGVLEEVHQHALDTIAVDRHERPAWRWDHLDARALLWGDLGSDLGRELREVDR